MTSDTWGVEIMEKKRGLECTSKNGRGVAENSYNGIITRITADAL